MTTQSETDALEIADMVVVSCDGKNALVDFVVWDAEAWTFATVRMQLSPGCDRLAPVAPLGITNKLHRALMESREAYEDVLETMRAQRDALREMN